MTKARAPGHTVAFIDEYCTHYQPVFPNVRQFEQFTRLELGWVAETQRTYLHRRSPQHTENTAHSKRKQ